MNKKKKTLFRELIVLPVTIAVLLFVFVILAKSVFVIVKKNIEVRREMQLVRAKQTELEQKRNDLEETLSTLNTEEGMEAEIRNKFFVVKPGEQIIVITDQVEDKDAAQGDNSDTIPWWRRIFGRK